MTNQSMTRRGWREPTTLGILATGAAALAVIAATAVIYLGSGDGLALAIVALMAAGASVGVVELVRCAGTLRELESGLAELPERATEADLERVDRRLRSLLRARLSGTARPVRGAEFTPYLVGLLVMLGLLGTFLGLFDAMRGARMVVAGSRDAASLHEALAAPLGGLTLSFGTSAAGLSASAMLGLGAVLLRRRERRFEVRLADAATGALAQLAPSRRQHQLLEQATAQTAAMPAAAAALTTAASELGGLGDLWASHQRKSAQASADAFAGAAAAVTHAFERGMERSRESLERVLAEVRESLASSIEQSTSAVGDAMEPLVARAVAGTVTAATDHLAKAHALVERNAAERAAADDARWAQVDRRLDGLLSAVEASATERRDADERTAARTAAQLAALVGRIDADAAVRRDADAAAAAARRDADDHVADRTAEQIGALLGRVDADAAARRDADDDAARARRDADERAAERTAAQLDAMFDRFATDAAMWRDTDRAAGAVRRDADERSAADAAARFATLFERLEAGQDAQRAHVQTLAERIAADHDARRDADARYWDRVVAHMAEDREHSAATAAAMRSLFDDIAELDRGRSEQLGALVDRTQAELAATIDAARTQLGDASAAVTEQLVRAGEAVGAQLSAVADADATRHEAAVGAMGALVDASTTVAAELDAALSSQREQWLGFETSLLAMHKAAFDAAGMRLQTHIQQVGEQISQVTGSARTATDALAAGSGELTACAEMLAASVDRHRDAANLWLDSLGAVDAAVQDAGEGAAAEALSKQLSSTSELFAQQLEFHRELFDQLRGLRAVGAAATGSGNDDGNDHADGNGHANANANANDDGHANANDDGNGHGHANANRANGNGRANANGKNGKHVRA